MSIPNPLQQNDDRLSDNAKRMLALREHVLAEWCKRVREAVQEAQNLSHPLLINTFPAFYENLVQALSPAFPRSYREDGNTVASEHGGERARLTRYNTRAIISEYQLLRWTVFDVLQLAGIALNKEECHAVNAAIDSAICDAVAAFETTQSAWRERFIAALAHDLRTPLTTAHAAAELIQHGKPAEEAPRLATRILANLDRMDGMIRELLDVAAFQTGERLRLHITRFDLSELAREVADQFNTLHPNRIQLEAKEVWGWWDKEAVKRAMENLIGNALKYGRLGAPVQLGLTSSHERVVIAVHNEGDPIPPEQIETVFQVFRRTYAARQGDTQGWGIGVPFVRAVAESHGGSLGVDSASGRGTTFFLDIPLDARPYQDAPTL